MSQDLLGGDQHQLHSKQSISSNSSGSLDETDENRQEKDCLLKSPRFLSNLWNFFNLIRLRLESELTAEPFQTIVIILGLGLILILSLVGWCFCYRRILDSIQRWRIRSKKSILKYKPTRNVSKIGVEINRTARWYRNNSGVGGRGGVGGVGGRILHALNMVPISSGTLSNESSLDLNPKSSMQSSQSKLQSLPSVVDFGRDFLRTKTPPKFSNKKDGFGDGNGGGGGRHVVVAVDDGEDLLLRKCNQNLTKIESLDSSLKKNIPDRKCLKNFKNNFKPILKWKKNSQEKSLQKNFKNSNRNVTREAEEEEEEENKVCVVREKNKKKTFENFTNEI